MELTYSKRQITPLIEKFSINVNSNETFKKIIYLFNEQTNYQIWAIKAVFGGVTTIDNIEFIKEWIDNNQTEIHLLAKGNIVSYKSEYDFAQLMSEINGANMVKLIRNCINRFNTDQKAIFNQNILAKINNFSEANSSRLIKEWFKTFQQMLTLPTHRQEKLISTSSALRDIAQLKAHIANALSASYTWNKEDMLGFMVRNCSDCSVVYDSEHVVVLHIPSFKSSSLLCGGGRTGWCLTREERYFNQYVKDYKDNRQYFLFDFSKREDHELAHIGFTVKLGQGIVNAHSTRNSNLCGSGIKVDNQTVNIHKALEMAGVPKNVYITLKELTNYKWNVENFLKYIEAHKREAVISYAKDNRFIIRTLTPNITSMLLSHTLINQRSFQTNDNSKTYLLFDFNLNVNDDNSIIAINYVKDMYNFDSLRTVADAYNVTKKDLSYVESLGITSEMFLNREKIDPNILLHKLIDEKSENEAINLIVKEGDDIDVNYVFNDRVPIFSVVSQQMSKLFEVIINHKSFDCNVKDPLGENILQCLLYMYSEDENDKNNKNIRNMIEMILNNPNFDFNAVNINDDTPINIAAENPHLLWVFESLVNRPNVNINVVNDFNCAALGNAIRKNNIRAIAMLGQRHDLVIREEDVELAKKFNINLNEYICPEVLSKGIVPKRQLTEEELSFAEIFEKAFN